MDSPIKPILTVSTMALPQTIDGSAASPVTVDPSSKKLVFKGDDELKPEILRTRKELGEYSVANLHSSILHKSKGDQLLLTQPDKLLGNSTAREESKVIKAFKKGGVTSNQCVKICR
ncbi:hypothetical protein [Endozoicomonas sp. 4G]|uniref:hypothetical protein n=1 Tax=Endozoicomonas sp. 4G TaxID=2872754 RepID=UPI002078F93C|nr:hypothetical protein [Endozoicomonas sp. 4G]